MTSDLAITQGIDRTHRNPGFPECCHLVTLSCQTPWAEGRQASLSSTIYQSLLKVMFIESMMPSKHLILCHLPLLLPSIFPRVRVFSNELALHIKWPKYWSFSLSIRSSSEYSGLTSFRIDWFGLLAVQGTLNSLLQHHSSILKGISPEYSLEGLMLRLKLQYFGHLMRRANSLGKIPMLGKIEGRRKRGQQRVRFWKASLTQWTCV